MGNEVLKTVEMRQRVKERAKLREYYRSTHGGRERMKLTELHLLTAHREIFDISLQLILVSVPLLDLSLLSSTKWERGTLLLPKQPSVEQVLKFLNRQGNTTICKPNVCTASWTLLEY